MTWLAALPSRLWGYALAALGALALLLTARAGWRRAGRAEAERDALGLDLERRDRADEAAGSYRGDGAARRLRDGRF